MTRVRLWQAGDMPGVNNKINIKKTRRLVSACQGLQAFGYTHKEPSIGNNAKAIKYCNDNGVTINLSANNLGHADALVELGVGPVVVVLPKDSPRKNIRTPAGRRVLVCPAENTSITCKSCGGSKGALCYRVDRRFIIGFVAHGTGAKRVSEVARK
jgi:hypothetical protein